MLFVEQSLFRYGGSMFLRTTFVIVTCTLIAACNDDNGTNAEVETVISDSSCDLESVNLLDFEAWQ